MCDLNDWPVTRSQASAPASPASEGSFKFQAVVLVGGVADSEGVGNLNFQLKDGGASGGEWGENGRLGRRGSEREPASDFGGQC